MISLEHLHPMLVHFPIALVMVGFAAQLCAQLCKKITIASELGYYLLLVGTLAGVVALLSGVIFTAEMSGTAGEVKETHELFAWITIGLLVTTSGLTLYLRAKNLQDSNLKWVALGLYGLAAIAVSITGFYGGTLVYNYMMPI